MATPQHLGEFGCYQKRILFLTSLVGITVALNDIASVFLTATMDHWCTVPDYDRLNCSGIDIMTEGHVCQQLKIIPDGSTGQCSRFNVSTGADVVYYNANMSAVYKTIPCDQGWQYDTSQSSIVSEFDLVCSKEDLVGYANSIYFAGVLVGSVLLGTVADWIGRFPTFFLSVGLTSLFGTLTAFANSYTAFVILRFFVAAFNIEMLIVSFIIGTELLGTSKRELPGIILGVTFAIGYMTLAVLAYFIRDWRHLQLVISLPTLLFFLLALIMHESPRWLISHKKYERAEKIIRKAAKVNNVTIPAELLTTDDCKTTEVAVERTYGYTLLDLFRTPKMRKKTFIILFNWFVINMVYYGLALSTSGLGVNEYVAAFVSGAVEIPAVLFGWFTIQRWGRRTSHCMYMVIGGVACLITVMLPLGVSRTAVAMIGKFGVSASFAIVYIYSAELYPTVVRSIGMGVSSMAARVSGVLSPIILLLQKYWQPLPLVVFGTCSIVAGLLILLLPETLEESLPETLQDGESFGRNSKCGLKSCISRKHKDNGTKGKHEPQDGNYREIATDEDAPAAV